MKNKIPIAIIILLSVLLFNQCRQTAQFKNTLNNNELAKADTIDYYINAIGLEVAEKRTYKGTSEDLQRYLEQQKKESAQFKEASKKWKKLYYAAKIDLQFKIDSIDVPFNSPVDYKFTRDFLKETKDYSIKGTANQNGLNIDFRAKATITPFTGLKPTGLFNSNLQTEITSSTNHLQITDFDAFQFVEKKKRWSLNSSIFVNVKGEINAGIGIGYDLFRF
jgi:hypothetical protein